MGAELKVMAMTISMRDWNNHEQDETYCGEDKGARLGSGEPVAKARNGINDRTGRDFRRAQTLSIPG